MPEREQKRTASEGGLTGNYSETHHQKVEFKIFKWGEKGPYSCSECGACWILEWDRTSTKGSSSIGTVEIIEEEETAENNDDVVAGGLT